ncbi:4a-hydroxytetrahydrobiopterin dehydratase [Candidatus Gottesmanbacteria bacterium RIFCSPHIGHO2_02_FULL_40_24]|uniref:Putative pterin-4-alpha-carbinolamine dehydratase n=1 Tax=Candidatus Gottesmanbacteria bacterium RIFCSPHIGHO2_01_FULL_40_15 TaxID=1798376 RepID=A0A1F5Z3I5_9BACT|nr:MAG: 4a-hydroxytetrahydrobiopterin dehydratase [Candidatus Gottesmanbacteria bacterium RIFCSPHIGHO2_01_FULL_40_15]OGG18661.1 MAG: 4a-hydroxytetrahydrobiopterin dehydratase [Candidatus Gottesmanbacteria bacterium RIFCSPHIGHO2_02_FULL_40_24]OGG22795.1 MAG: 4a-hydroxytetrahydrobiopterin dehydratase [Candidatus Gottesmanbacteria bacterium RIFCSPLOWO2_01_FULL_40_10]OGG22953.1 MAG: 4a-hydroxytetrahydrobiopterin dehydratase [Candidatus Gottesmanbacteria bacterium RIFCSPHIGHO2_12_FULL_40_13]OGG31873
MTDLTKKKCVPCEGGEPPLEKEKVNILLKEVSGWELVEGMVVRKFKFKDFREAVDFVNRVADLSEEENHHPNISIYGWNKVKLTFYTHKINGLSENDFIMAAKVNKILS